MKTFLSALAIAACLNIYAQEGTLDPTFGNGGKLTTNINGDEAAYGMVLQPDGKIVITGYTYNPIYGNDVICMRYNTNGSIDSTFGTNGIASFDIQPGSDDKALAIAIQSDNKLVLAGYTDNGTDKQALLMRLNTDGTLDTDFGNGGKVLTGFSTTGVPVRQDEYRTVKIDLISGNIVTGGSTYSASNNSRALVARYTPAGVLDTTFGTGGKFAEFPNSIVTSNYLFSIEDLAIKPNGKITVIGIDIAYMYLARLNTNGTMDTTFSTDGYNDNYDGQVYAVVLNNDDSFYFTGDINTQPETQVYTGKIGGTGGGIAATPFFFGSTMKATSFAMAKDSNGKLVVAGYLRNNNTGATSFLVGRVLPTLTADTTFGTSGTPGFTTTAFDDAVSGCFGMKIQTDGKIVVAGRSGTKIALARYNAFALGTADLAQNNSVKLYPVPANDYLNIDLGDSDFQHLKYSIADVSGRTIKSGTLNTNQERVRIADLKGGVYLITFEGKADALKFIKN